MGNFDPKEKQYYEYLKWLHLFITLLIIILNSLQIVNYGSSSLCILNVIQIKKPCIRINRIIPEVHNFQSESLHSKSTYSSFSYWFIHLFIDIDFSLIQTVAVHLPHAVVAQSAPFPDNITQKWWLWLIAPCIIIIRITFIITCSLSCLW